MRHEHQMLLVSSIDEVGRSWGFYFDGRSEVWIAGPKLPRFLPIGLEWQLARADTTQWTVRVRDGWFAVLFRLNGPNASGDGIEGERLRSSAVEVDGGWEFPLDEDSSVIIHTESWKLHLSLFSSPPGVPGSRLVLHQGEKGACHFVQGSAASEGS